MAGRPSAGVAAAASSSRLRREGRGENRRVRRVAPLRPRADVPAGRDARRGESPDSVDAFRSRPVPRRAGRRARGFRPSGGTGPRSRLESRARARGHRAAHRRRLRPAAPRADRALPRRLRGHPVAAAAAPAGGGDPQRRQRPQRPVRPGLVGAARDRRGARLRRHAGRLDRVRAGDRHGLRHVRKGRPARVRGARGRRVSRREPADRGRSRGPVDARGRPALHQRLPLGASESGRSGQRLPLGQRRARMADPGGDARDPSEAGALHAARGLRDAALPADRGRRRLARNARGGHRAGGRRGSRARGGVRPLRGEPRVRIPCGGDRCPRDDVPALRPDARSRRGRGHRPLRRSAPHVRHRRVRGLRRRASRAAHRAPRHRHLPGGGISGARSPSRNRPQFARQRKAARLRSDGHPRAPAGRSAGVLDALRAPDPRLARGADRRGSGGARTTHRRDRRAAPRTAIGPPTSTSRS